MSREWASRSIGSAEQGYINYLFRGRHGTPFQMVEFTFRVYGPLALAEEWGRLGTTLIRRSGLEPNFEIPSPDEMVTRCGEPGRYTLEPMNAGDADLVKGHMQMAYATAFDQYRIMVRRGLDEKVARNVLPLGTYTEFIWKVNLLNLLDLLALPVICKLVERVVPAAVTAWEQFKMPKRGDFHDCDTCDHHARTR